MPELPAAVRSITRADDNLRRLPLLGSYSVCLPNELEMLLVGGCNLKDVQSLPLSFAMHTCLQEEPVQEPPLAEPPKACRTRVGYTSAYFKSATHPKTYPNFTMAK